MHELIRYVLASLVIAVVIWLLVRVAIRAVDWARAGSPAAAFFGWALLLLGAGMNPQRPPQEQVEEAGREKNLRKGSDSGDPNR